MPAEIETGDLGQSPFRIGEWLIEPSLNRLSRGDTTIQLELKVMDVLVCLAERAGEVVTRIEIVDRVWATEFIADNTLTHAINEIRTALGDDARKPTFIETIHRRGYRLMVPVTLEERPAGTVTQFPSRARPNSDEDLSPYPGLAAFTEGDAEFFFGREAEVAKMWRKLTSRRLLGVIGPSGVGKSSFLRAGLIPAAPEGWGILICQPGEAPFAALARALVPEFEGDREAIARLVHLTEPEETVAMVSRWRHEHDQALLIVDQFEELFTLSPPDTRARFAALLRTIVDQADIHVLLSMRDDFLYRCTAQAALRPIFEDLTPLEQPNRASLHRALVEPAARLGYAFENDDLVGAMLDEVSDERSALPLLAFAVARLWDTRDHDRRLLTRAAHDDIGGVGGALARHAEATLRAIGDERRPMVREVFRNLITAEGTRAVRSFDDLVSVFPVERRQDATDVIRQLIDARLLTSFEDGSRENGRRHRIEVVHESLLSAWPRLVGWRTQEADSARLRDELRQAARTWDEHGRTDDVLWSGTAYREFAVWRERYPGGLSTTEEDFASAMTSLATRRRRRRRIAAAGAFAALLVVLVVVGALWQKSIRETNRAEAAKLLALGQVVLDSYPSATLAWATSSLELADTREGRLLALRALQKAPPVLVLPMQPEKGRGAAKVVFSPDGQRLATAEDHALVWSQNDPEPMVLEHQPPGGWINLAFPTNNLLLTERGGNLWLWTLPGGEMTRREPRGKGQFLGQRGEGYFKLAFVEGGLHLDWWPMSEGDRRSVGSLDYVGGFDIDAQGSQFAFSRGETVMVRSIENWDRPPTVLGRHDRKVWNLAFHPSGDRVAAFDESREIREWQTEANAAGPIRTFSSESPVDGSLNLLYDQAGRWLATFGGGDDGLPMATAWDLTAPQGCAPLVLRAEKGYANPYSLAFHPDGSWLVAAPYYSAEFWPMTHKYPWVLPHHGRVFDVAFTPDSSWLVTVTDGFVDPEDPDHSGRVRAWPLRGQNNGQDRVLLKLPPGAFYASRLDIDPTGKYVAVSARSGNVGIVPLEGGPVRRLAISSGPSEGFPFITFSPDGRSLASVPLFGSAEGMVVRVWDLETGEDRVIGPVAGQTSYLGYVGDHQLLWAGADARTEDEAGGGERLFDLELGTVEVLSEGGSEQFRAMSPEGTFVVSTEMLGSMTDYSSRLVRRDLETGESKVLQTHGDNTYAVDLDPTGRFVATGDFSDGAVRVGSVGGDDPYIFYGHTAEIQAVAISPDGRWIASSSYDGTVRLTPMPDLTKPPLHTLPHDELIAKLKTLTNLRVVRDHESSTGWNVEIGPFPGWAEVPEW